MTQEPPGADATRRKRGVAILDTDSGELVDVNNGYAAIFNTEPEQLIGSKPPYIAEVESELVIPVFEAMHGRTRGLYELLADEADGEYTFYRDIDQSDGSQLFVQFTIEQLSFDGDQFVLVTAVAPHMDAPYYNTLERFRYRLDALMFDNRVAWWEFDVDTGEAIFHENKVQMLGISPGDIEYLEDYIRVLDDDATDVVGSSVDRLRSGESETEEVVYSVDLPSGKRRWLREIGAVTQYDEELQPTTITGLTVDITAQKEAEAREQELASKVSLLTQLLTHDINGDLELAMEYLRDADPTGQNDALEAASKAAEHALISIEAVQEVIQRTVDGEIEDLPTEPISVKTALKHELARFERTHDCDISVTGLKKDTYAEASPILCSVIHSVLEDAAQSDDDHDIEIAVRTDDDAVQIEFSYHQDSPPEDSGTSVTGPEDTDGSFGLRLSREIIEAYGGGVWVDWENDEKHITIELPRADSELLSQSTAQE